MKNLYVLAVYGFKNCSLIGLNTYDQAGAERAIRWQHTGGFTEPYHIVTAHPTERATFVSIETGNHFEANRGAFTEKAWRDFVNQTWRSA